MSIVESPPSAPDRGVTKRVGYAATVARSRWHRRLTAAFAGAATMQDILAVFVDGAASLGFKYCCYGVRVPLPVSRQRVLLFDNYPAGWMDGYREQQWLAVDPALLLRSSAQTPLVRSEDIALQAPLLWREAQNCGLRLGWTHVSWDRVGVLGLLSLARPEHEVTNVEVADRCARLRWLTHTGHAMAVARCFPELVPEAAAELTAREQEVLMWTADGKTASEIAAILRMSQRTVNFHITNAAKKLNCNNKLQAVVKAVMLGLLWTV